MKLIGSEGATRSVAARRPHTADRNDHPTFSLALTIPVSWEVLAAPPDDAMLDRLDRANRALLGTLLKGADLGAPPVDDEVLVEALEPLRAKLDFLVEMVARLAYRDQVLPDRHAVEVGVSHIHWTQRDAIAPDTWLLTKLYFNDTFREPVSLAGRVKACVAHVAVNGIELDLAAMSDDLAESFARLVFLEHRHQLAQHAAPHAAERRR